jgi:hypothetical protein
METPHIFDEYKTINNVEDMHSKRTKLEPLIYDILKNKYYNIFDEFWEKNIVKTDTNKSIVIIERRIHENLAFLIRNMFYYARDWSITVLCSDINFEYLKSITTHNSSNVLLLPVFIGNPDRDTARNEYNTLLKQAEFYRLLPFEHIFIVQTDTYLRKKIDESMFEYDYVAGHFAWDTTSAGGGMSYRKQSSMIDICTNFKKDIPMEDCFINEGVKLLGYKMPTVEKGVKYIAESCYDIDPMGVHQWWAFMGNNGSDFHIDRFYNYLNLQILKD